MYSKTVSIIGMGYIGLPTAAIIASKKINVIGVDINKKVVETINRGEIHIIEPGLKDIVKDCVDKKYLNVYIEPKKSDVYLIAVPTPFKEKKNEIPEPNLEYVFSAVESISSLLKNGDLIILESTSPVGTTELMMSKLKELRPDLVFPDSNKSPDINIAYCPERVMPGKIVQELENNDRVIGGISEECSLRAKEFYTKFVKGKILLTNSKTAEMVKLTENACRDSQIAFANELSLICNKLDINVWELINLANRHPRVDILMPGPGVGGHCIAVDPWFIVSKNPKTAKLIKKSREINDGKKEEVIKIIINAISKHKADANLPEDYKIRLAFYGITYKPDIDDVRESPALEIVKAMSREPAEIIVVEPNISNIDGYLPNAIHKVNPLNINADLHILLVNHKEFIDISTNTINHIDFSGAWSKPL